MASFLEVLAERPLLFDGAIGSLLYDHGVLHTACYDELNLSRPQLLRDIHREYRAAGADILETNTFGANRICRSPATATPIELGEINRAGVAARSRMRPTARSWPARSARPESRFNVATDLPSERLMLTSRTGRADDAILVEAGVRPPRARDVRLDRRTRSGDSRPRRSSTWRPTCRSSPRWCSTAEGLVRGHARSIGRRGHSPGGRAGADVVGANCGSRPTRTVRRRPGDDRWSTPAFPSRSSPTPGLPSPHRRPHDLRCEPRTLRRVRPDDMLKSGVRLIGGCCGHHPRSRARSMHGAVRMMRGGAVARRSPCDVLTERPRPAEAPTGPRPASPSAAGSAPAIAGGRVRGVGRARLHPTGTNTTKVPLDNGCVAGPRRRHR